MVEPYEGHEARSPKSGETRKGKDGELLFAYASKLEDALLTFAVEHHGLAHKWTNKPFSECEVGFCPRVREVLFDGTDE